MGEQDLQNLLWRQDFQSPRPKDISEAYKMHEQLKKLKYEQRIREVEKASFNPLVFSCTGGAGPSASKVIKRIAGKLSEKKEDSYSDIITYNRTKISFALLRSSILCLRGSRALLRRGVVEASIGTVVEEGRLLIVYHASCLHSYTVYVPVCIYKIILWLK